MPLEDELAPEEQTVEEPQEEEYEEEEGQELDLEDELPQDGDEEIEEPQSGFTFTVPNDDGEEEEKTFTEDELKELIMKSRGLDDLEQQAALASRLMPLAQLVNDSQIIQTVMHYRNQGYSDEQIESAIARKVQQSSGEQAEGEDQPEFDSLEEQVAYMVEKKLNEQIAPLKNEFQSTKAQQEEATVLQHNDNVFASALKDFDYDPTRMNNGQTKAMVNVMTKLYPNVDYRTHKFTKDQAEVIIEKSIGRRKGAVKKRKEAQQVTRQASAPQVMPGNTGGAKSTKKNFQGESPMKISTMNERIRDWSSLFKEKTPTR